MLEGRNRRHTSTVFQDLSIDPWVPQNYPWQLSRMESIGSVRDRGREYAVQLDNSDGLKKLRKEFIIPSKNDLRSKNLGRHGKIISM